MKLFWRAVVIGASLAALLLISACTSKVELMAALPESDANEVLGALQNAGIPAEKIPGKEGMVGLQIAADQVGRAVDLLREQGLPREKFAGMGQVFKKEGLISSPLEERARYLYALSQELGATLNQIDGVIVARVHVVLPERSASGEAPQPSSAAVFLKYQDGYDIESLQPLVRRLVLNSIPGLSAEKLTIVMVPSQSQRARVQPAAAAPGLVIAPAASVPAKEPSPVGRGAESTQQATAAVDGAGAGMGWQLILLLLGLLCLVAAGGMVAWRKGRLARWLPAPVRARLERG